MGDTSAAVRTAFNMDIGKVRVVIVVSPTCAACLEGASEVSQLVAGINQGKTVPLYVLWVPRRGGKEKDIPNATRVIADSSAHEFWDGNNLFGMQYGHVLGWRGNAWDVYMIYGPKAEWNGDLPPVPDFFMHQTSEKGPQLDASLFGTKLKQLLREALQQATQPNSFDWNRQRCAVARAIVLDIVVRPNSWPMAVRPFVLIIQTVRFNLMLRKINGLRVGPVLDIVVRFQGLEDASCTLPSRSGMLGPWAASHYIPRLRTPPCEVRYRRSYGCGSCLENSSGPTIQHVACGRRTTVACALVLQAA